MLQKNKNGFHPGIKDVAERREVKIDCLKIIDFIIENLKKNTSVEYIG
jgi:hypothetical protein